MIVKIILNECVTKQHCMVVCKMVLMVKKKKAESKAKDMLVETEDKLSRSV